LAAFPQIPRSGECPPEDTYIDDEEQMRLLFNSNRQIILPRVSLYTEPKFRNPIRNGELKFLQHVVVLKENVTFSRAKLVRAGKRCGWIPENAVLGSNRPMKVQEIFGFPCAPLIFMICKCKWLNFVKSLNIEVVTMICVTLW